VSQRVVQNTRKIPVNLINHITWSNADLTTVKLFASYYVDTVDNFFIKWCLPVNDMSQWLHFFPKKRREDSKRTHKSIFRKSDHLSRSAVIGKGVSRFYH
jgi:hypothetical protein